MADLLERAVELFSEVCDLEQREQALRLDSLTPDESDLRAKVEELLAGDRVPDARLERTAGDFVRLDDLAPGDFGELEASEVFARLGERGKTIDHYRIEEEIGRGGMGSIHAVWDEDLGRRLAMKVVHGRTATPATLVAPRFRRFFDEVRVTGQLDHPGIVPVHDVGIDPEGRAYFTMKLVKGITLGDVFRKVAAGEDGWSRTRALGVLLRVCEAMAYAHAKGVVHRDLKPSNVMVGRFGEVYVMDWGVAWLKSRGDVRDLRPRAPDAGALEPGERSDEIRLASPVVTMDGTVVGTPFYMSPEQARGGLVDERSDVYAVGAMVYALLTGAPPYRKADGADADTSPGEVLARVIAGPPEPLQGPGEDVSAELEAICKKAMARASEERYADMSAFADDLRAFLEGRVVQAHRTGAGAELSKWVERNRKLALSSAAGVLALVLGLVASLVLWRAADENAVLAEKREELANQRAEEAAVEREKVLRLLTLSRKESLVERADVLWPAHPENVPAFRDWLAQAEALAAVGADPAVALQLAELRARALPRGDAEREADRRTHPTFPELVLARQRLDAARHADDVRAGRAEAADLAPDPALPEDARALDALAWPLVAPGRTEFGREAEGLAIARLASFQGTSDAEVARAGATLAWAALANGLDDEALAECAAAREAATGTPDEATLVASLDALERAVEEARSGARVARLEAERAALDARVDARRTWRFADANDATWHGLLTRLTEEMDVLTDPETGLIAGFSEEHGWGVARRAAWAGEVAARTTTGPDVRGLWDAALASIADPQRSPLYGGLVLAPQLGLVPLGPDPASGLWEFGHAATGELPVRDARGRLELRPETGLVFVLLPGGTFRMGAQAGDPDAPNHDPAARREEGPVRSVTLSPFFLSKYELTQAQWQRFAGRDPSYYRVGSQPGITSLHPVESVSWKECERFCRRLGLELPTEAQWEYAARAGRGTPWSTGAAREDLIGSVNLADASARRAGAPWPSVGDWPELDDGFPLHAPVGSFDPNAFGLHELHGNVWEWCADAFDRDAYRERAGTDPAHPGAPHDARVYRGGSFRETSTDARCARRGNDLPNDAASYLGLRPARGIAD